MEEKKYAFHQKASGSPRCPGKIGSLLVGLLLGIVVLASCTSVQYMSVDALLPADVSFAPTIRRVAVVNNTVPGETEERPVLVLERMFPGDGALLAEEIAKQIADAEYFDQVILSDSLLRGNRFQQPPHTLSSAEADALLQALEADMLLSVDVIQWKASHAWVADYMDDEPVPGVAVALEVATRLYLPSREHPFQRFSDRDTLYWPLEGLAFRDMVRDVSLHASTLPLKHVVPQWRQEVRFYYGGGSYEMRDASVAVKENDWELAYTLWKKVYDRKKKGKARMRAALNLAFYHEMQGNLPEACRYVDEAAKLASPKSEEQEEQLPSDRSDDGLIINSYRQALQDKMMLQQKLDLQMSRFKEEK